MIIQTSRFGQVQLETNDQITFPDGILGFAELKKFVLLDDPNDEIFAWLQSCEEPGIAFPVLEPELFVENYKVNLAKSDMEALGLTPSEGEKALAILSYFTIVTFPEDATKMTANLKAPVLVNRATRIARQVVLQDNAWAIREPIFQRLQQRVVAKPNEPLKRAEGAMDVAVRLTDREL